MTNSKIKVAVIGTGAIGLVTVKNLLEEGFDVTGFERNDYVGGLWKYTLAETTSVLPSTVINVSKERGCFTDFPFPDDTPSLCPSANVQMYLESYADHFGLRPHIRLNTVVQQVRRDDTADSWLVDIQGQPSEAFDKLVLATGINQDPTTPKIEGVESFAGEVLHSQAFKSPEAFDGKSVLIVGIGNTAGDTATALVGHARSIYLAHRHGAYILPRTRHGQCSDHALTYRLLQIQGVLERCAPGLAERLLNKMVGQFQAEAFPSIARHPEWGLSPAPSLKQVVPCVSDDLVPALERGAVQSVPGLRRVVGPHAVEVDATFGGSVDDAVAGPATTRLDDIDVIIFCTGYQANLAGLLPPDLRPTRDTTPAWAATPGARGKPLPRLYRNIFSLDYPQSLALMGAVAFTTPAFQLYDLASMALAQIWGGHAALPSAAEMARSVDAQQAWITELARKGPVYPGLVPQHAWLAWADETAGCGVGAHLGWGPAGWRLWLTDHALYRQLVGGVYSPHLYRVFAGRRKRWDGARAAIFAMNARLAQEKDKRV